LTRAAGHRPLFTQATSRECGNAYAPLLYEHYSGSRADGFLEVMLGATQVGDCCPATEVVV